MNSPISLSVDVAPHHGAMMSNAKTINAAKAAMLLAWVDLVIMAFIDQSSGTGPLAEMREPEEKLNAQPATASPD